ELEDEGGERGHQADEGAEAGSETLLAPLAEREDETAEEAADEAAGVPDVVDAADQEAGHEHDHGPDPVLLEDQPPERPAPLAPEGDQRAEQAEDRAGRAQRQVRAPQARGEEARDPGHGVDDDEASGTEHRLDVGAESPEPEHVEQDVEQPAVEE